MSSKHRLPSKKTVTPSSKNAELIDSILHDANIQTPRELDGRDGNAHIKKMQVDFRSENQKKFWNMIEDNDITICSGAAGTGKSHIQIAKALDLMRRFPDKYKKLILVPINPNVDEYSMGHIPGTVDEKLSGYIFPTRYILEKLLSKDKVEKMFAQYKIEIMPLIYLRGINVSNAVLIIDECQNLNQSMLKTLLTRISDDAKFIISGDIEQQDRTLRKNEINGLSIAINKLTGVDGIGIMEFNHQDIVRHRLTGIILDRLNTIE